MLFSETLSFISPFIEKKKTKTNKCYSLIFMVFRYLSWLRLILLTRMQIFMRNRICFLFRYLSNHRSMFTKFLRKREEKHCRQDTCSSSLFKTPRRLHLDETLQECVFSKFLTLLTNACITQLQMNHILWKRFRFSDNLFVFYFVHYLNWACYRFNELDALRKRSVPTIDDFYLG